MSLLTEALQIHKEKFPEEGNTASDIMVFLEKHGEKAFHNWHWDDGHITASMLITNTDFSKVLLIFHKKLQRWLQFGGHSDDSPDVLSTAFREFHEESGVKEEPEIFSHSPTSPFPIFDLDIHCIPADAKGRPEHKHYDIRFLGKISDDVILDRQVDETDDIGWFTLDEAEKIIEEDGLSRMIEKIRTIKNA